MTNYTATDTIPAGMVRPGHVINAQEIFAQWPANAPILSPLDALPDDDPVTNLKFLTVTGTWNDGPDVAVFKFHNGDFGVMIDQPVRIFEEA